MKCLREKKQMSDYGLPCWGVVAGSKGFHSWAAALEKTEGSLTLSSPSSPKNGAGFVSQNGGICTAVWAPGRRRGRKDWGGRRAPALPARGQAQGWGKISLWVFPSGLLTGCLLSKARGQRTSLRHQLLLIAFPKAQAGHRGASHKKDPF